MQHAAFLIRVILYCLQVRYSAVHGGVLLLLNACPLYMGLQRNLKSIHFYVLQTVVVYSVQKPCLIRNNGFVMSALS